MGYSTPKKQLDLKEFLSTPAKRLPYKKKFSQVQVAQKMQDGTEKNENENIYLAFPPYRANPRWHYCAAETIFCKNYVQNIEK